MTVQHTYMAEKNLLSDIPRLSPVEWRARKQERREKQRRANVGRALKMHAARLVPELPLHLSEKLPRFNIGCSGWFYWHWRGAFYPQDVPTKDWFAYYQKHFHTVELNAPFYSWPTVNTVKTWARQAKNGKFIYTVKVCELITHVKRFSRTHTLVKDFGFIADVLGTHMGCFLFQLPPRLSLHASALVKKFWRNWIHRGAMSLNSGIAVGGMEKSMPLLKKAGVIFCSSSAPNLP